MGYGVSALAVLGDTAGVSAWINRAVLVDPTNYNMPYNVVCSLMPQLGDIAPALELLDAFFAQARSGDLHHARLDPDLDVVRRDPRFVRMLDAAERRLAAGSATEAPNGP
jgi:adenylate cyclase